MTLSERLTELVRAAFSGLWIQSHEHDDAIAEIAGLCRAQGWSLATWDIDRGLAVAGAAQAESPVTATDPLAAIRAAGALATPDGTAVIVMRNLHRFLNSIEIIQALDSAIAAGKQTRTILIVLAPVVNLPPELERLFLVLDHELPGTAQLETIARGTAVEPGELPEGQDLQNVLEAAAGLTRLEAENAFALSLVRHGRLEPEVLWELKSQTLRKSGLLTLHKGGERFDNLGGLEAIKRFCTRALRPDRPRGVTARGILLLGPPGTGKSAFAKALGVETDRPTLILDVGSLMGSLVGQTESNIRQALKLIDAMAPAVVMIDEVEKALSGVASSGQTDSGVSARLFGSFLTWLNDHESDVFVVCTSNDVSKLPPEFARAERFDGTFFLDLPSSTQREQIWRQYLTHFALDPDQPRPQARDWTGAEIRACCRLAALLDLSLIEAATNIVPVAVTAGEAIENLRSWASGRCLDADRPGLYTRGRSGGDRPGRQVARKPSEN